MAVWSGVKRKLKDQKGISLFLLLTGLLLLIAILLIILIPGYMNHLNDIRMTYDTKSVATAKEVALVQFMQSAKENRQLYWYDEISHSVVDTREKSASIKGYGRSFAAQNRNSETGAAGVPCRSEEDGGSAILALVVTPEKIENIWWTGNAWSFWDYYYMTAEERKLLKPADYRAMDAASESTARDKARAQYEKDFKKQLEKGEDPGTVIYNYDLIEEKLYLDPSVPEELRGKKETLPASAISSYSLAESDDNIVQVTVSKADTKVDWVEGKHGV